MAERVVIREPSLTVKVCAPGLQGPPGGGGGGGAVTSVAGRTGDVVLTKTDVGLSAVDNTADTDKPVSTAQSAAIASAVAAAVAAHEAASDPHPDYATDADLSAGLAGKANATHSHAISDVGGLSAALSGKAEATHSHAISDVTGLSAALADKLDAAHAGSGGSAHALATGSVAGFMSAADKTKLDGIEAGATANAPDAALRDRTTHTGTQTASTISDFAAAARAQMEAALIEGANITITAAGSGATRAFTIASSGGGGGATDHYTTHWMNGVL